MPACTTSWCSILLYIVPARVDGTWQTPQGAMTLTQEFQKFSGSVGTTPVAEGKLDGEKISFTLGANTVTGVVNGNTIEGTVTANGKTSPWRATKAAAR